ncbi:type VI secretion system lipoprotein TssJ [Enterobacterales bacterium BD_CKDN230030183-1A_HGKHYDSX7]
MTRRVLLLIALTSAFLASVGCTTLTKLARVIMDPSVAVGSPEDQPTEVAFSINVSPTINRNPNSLTASVQGRSHQVLEETTEVSSPSWPDTEDTPGSYAEPTVILDLPDAKAEASEQIATPIAVKILQLRDDSVLRNSLYQSLDKDSAKTLRSTYIRGDDYLLFPGQFKFVPFTKVHAESRYIAVIADYGSEQDATWQQVLQIAPQGRHIVLSVLVQDSQLVLKEESR